MSRSCAAGCVIRATRTCRSIRSSRAARAFSAAVGALSRPWSLDGAGMDVETATCSITGPGGLLGAQRDIVHRERGVVARANRSRGRP